MANYVLVQGGNMSTDTWNKLAGRDDYPPGGHLGGAYWDGTVAALTAHNHRVFAPTLKDENVCDLTGHIDQICTLITENDLEDAILVGHSYGGMIITGVADRMADRIRRLVYLDAALPEPGESLFDIINLGLSTSSVSQPVLPEPALAYVEKLQFDPAKIRSLPKTYIRCTKSEFIVATSLAKHRIDTEGEGWTYIEFPSSHVPMADLPDKFYQLMLDVAEK
jgi:pimeloyl-ACP methyl ester carboxylesterase